mgnify:FL=1
MPMSAVIAPFTRADADAIIVATLRAAIQAEAEGRQAHADALRADLAELAAEFEAHFATL